MRTLAGLVLLSTLANCQQDIASDPEFKKFVEFINKFRSGVGYSSEIETVGRFTIFKENLRKAEARNARGLVNAKPNQKPESHGVTQFMDLTAQEFTARAKGYRPPVATAYKAKKKIHKGIPAAQSIDWNAKGALTPIKNQGQCGSCWAFSATEQLESQYFQKYSTLKELAPQQVVSCDTTCLGCNGGNPINAWGYVYGFGGQEPSGDYTYTSGITGQTGTCTSDAAEVVEDVGETFTMIANSTTEEANMLAQIQESPMSVCVDAELWQTYTGGVITAASGCGTSIDHAVQATGYNAPGNYWIVRNSWGETWGEQGFVYLEYGANVCGITDQATTVSVGVVDKLHRKLSAQQSIQI